MLLAPGRRADPGTRRRLDNGRGTFRIRPKRRLDPARDEVRTPAAGGAGTFCNPLDLPYRFKLNRPSRRGAADPTILAYRRRYIMFDSKSVRSPTDSVRRGCWSSRGPAARGVCAYRRRSSTLLPVARALYATDDPFAPAAAR